ncbi:MAG: GNAT family N-acetyltransferase [Ruminiclostridium sp.]|nr:GNAT family N-acetyltransferase [Ruminiclostridium sp.]
MIRIREAEATDLDDLLMLYSVLYGNNVLQKDRGLNKVWNRILEDPYYHIIVAEEDGKIVSTCMCVIIQNLTFEHRPYAVIDNIVTHSEYRAQGLATACLQEAQKIAEAAGCYKITLSTASRLPSTHRFYERLGYNKEGLTAFTQWLG